jgi:hypothetical protein
MANAKSPTGAWQCGYIQPRKNPIRTSRNHASIRSIPVYRCGGCGALFSERIHLIAGHVCRDELTTAYRHEFPNAEQSEEDIPAQTAAPPMVMTTSES